jgi:ubiquinone/menaquinone biosynthesis C-methylase UbiE
VGKFFQTLKQLLSQGIEGYFAIKYYEFAKNSKEMQREYAHLAENVASMLQRGKLLEIGPGPAYIAIETAKRIPKIEITGLEISNTMIEIAKNNAEGHGVSKKIAFQKGDASQMPFEDSEYDFVITSGSLHHWKKPTQTINEIYRVLKPGCSALISDLRKDAPKERIKEFANQIDSRIMRLGLMHSFREGYTARQIEEMVKSTQFKGAQIKEEEISMQILLKKLQQ